MSPESVTADERRTALREWLAAHDERGDRTGLTRAELARIFETVSRAALDPGGEAFPGERLKLLQFVSVYADHLGVEGAVIGKCLQALCLGETDWGAESRLQLLRAFVAFLIHDQATWHAVADRRDEEEADAAPLPPGVVVDLAAARKRLEPPPSPGAS